MGVEEFRNALRGRSEVELTVTGRKSGRESSRPVWFVEDDGKLFQLPVGGSNSNWYRNLVKTPTVGVAANGAEIRTEAKPIDDAAAVAEVVQRFRGRYGADQVAAYHPTVDAAVEVPLAERTSP